MARVSRKIGKEPKKITLSISNKNLIIRAIIAGVCLFLGIAFLLNSCSKFLNRDTYLTITYPSFKNAEDQEVILFDEEVDIQYYYVSANESKSTSQILDIIDNILNNEMIELFKLCDYNDLYKENNEYLHNIKYINDHPNEWISIDSRLYNLLVEANEIMKETNGSYSLFMGKLYNEWDKIFIDYKVNGANKGAIESIDPEYNEIKKELIINIVNAINHESTNIEFNKDNYQVKFNLNEIYRNYVSLDLGLVESAFYLDQLKEKFLANDLVSGYISNESGMVVTLGNNYYSNSYTYNSMSFQTLFNSSSTVLDYSFTFNGALNYMAFNPFLDISCHSVASINNYFFYKNNDIYYRSFILNALTGYSNTRNYSTFTFSSNRGLVSQLKDNYNLYFNDFDYNNEYLLQYEDEEKYGLIISFNNGNSNIAFDGQTTLLYSKLVSNYFKENYIPYIKVSTVVKNKIVATKGE